MTDALLQLKVKLKLPLSLKLSFSLLNQTVYFKIELLSAQSMQLKHPKIELLLCICTDLIYRPIDVYGQKFVLAKIYSH